jgi:hypothetical protein
MRVFVLGLLLSGCFSPSPQFPRPARFFAGESPYSVTTGDFNGDGRLDVVLVRSRSDVDYGLGPSPVAHGALSVLLGRGDGSFEVAFETVGNGGGGLHTAVTDLNGDGRLDLVVTNLVAGGYVSLLFGNGDGKFSGPVQQLAGGNLTSVRAADFNGDGKIDLVLSDARPAGDFLRGRIVTLIGHGDGSFDAPRSRDLPAYPGGSGARTLAVGDWNGDGHPDLALADEAASRIVILLGRGDGGFDDHAQLRTAYAPVGVSSADLNKDGRLDLIVAVGGRGISVYLGRGDGDFIHGIDEATGPTWSGAIADYDHDGNLDLAVGRRILRGDGTGRFPQQLSLPETDYDESFVFTGDFNNDGWADLVMADRAHNRLNVFMNRGQALSARR